MTTAIAAFLRVYDHTPPAGDDGTRLLWQNFFIGKAVDGYTYQSFDVADIVMNRSADEGGISITLPALSIHLDFFIAAIESEQLADIRLYEMDASTSMPTDLTSAVLVSRFVGEVIALSTNLTEIQIELGAAIDAVSGEIPGRRVTTSVVGRLPTL